MINAPVLRYLLSGRQKEISPEASSSFVYYHTYCAASRAYIHIATAAAASSASFLIFRGAAERRRDSITVGWPNFHYFV